MWYDTTKDDFSEDNCISSFLSSCEQDIKQDIFSNEMEFQVEENSEISSRVQELIVNRPPLSNQVTKESNDKTGVRNRPCAAVTGCLVPNTAVELNRVGSNEVAGPSESDNNFSIEVLLRETNSTRDSAIRMFEGQLAADKSIPNSEDIFLNQTEIHSVAERNIANSGDIISNQGKHQSVLIKNSPTSKAIVNQLESQLMPTDEIFASSRDIVVNHVENQSLERRNYANPKDVVVDQFKNQLVYEEVVASSKDAVANQIEYESFERRNYANSKDIVVDQSEDQLVSAEILASCQKENQSVVKRSNANSKTNFVNQLEDQLVSEEIFASSKEAVASQKEYQSVVKRRYANSNNVFVNQLENQFESGERFLSSKDTVVNQSEVQPIAEEIVIGIQPGESNSRVELFSVVELPKEDESVIVESAGFKPESQNVTATIVSNSRLNIPHQLNSICIKEQHNLTPVNHTFLSSTVSPVSRNNMLSVDWRDDSYSNNNIEDNEILAQLFSEVTMDNGSDDDSQDHNRVKYAGGGKVIREQMEDSKGDVGEECESSPSSLSDSHRTLEPEPVSPNTTYLPLLNSIVQDSSPEVEIDRPHQQLSPQQVRPVFEQMHESPRARINLSLLKEIPMHNVMANTKGMIISDKLHNETLGYDYGFSRLQHELPFHYSSSPNILLTEPCPYPKTAVVNPPIDGYTRCPCSECCRNFYYLVENFKMLVNIYFSLVDSHNQRDFSITIGEAEDLTLQTSKKSEVTTDVEDSVKELEPSNRYDEVVFTPDPPSAPEPIENSRKTENSSLPLKKRKAFNVDWSKPELILKQPETKRSKTDEENIGIPELKIKELEKSDSPKKHKSKTKKQTKDCSVVMERWNSQWADNRQCVKIKTIDGKFFVVSGPSPDVDDSKNSDEENDCILDRKTKSKHRKSCRRKSCKQSKEERRMRKERKRLKRERKRQKLNIL